MVTKDDGEERFSWPAAIGMWQPHIGDGTPGNFGQCGVLDRNCSSGGPDRKPWAGGCRRQSSPCDIGLAFDEELPGLRGLNPQAELEGRLCFTYGSAADHVAVARSNLDLPNQALTQARDRFASGGTDTLEVVQAQRSVAVANDNLITALYAHNLAKVELPRWGLPSDKSRNSWR